MMRDFEIIINSIMPPLLESDSEKNETYEEKSMGIPDHMGNIMSSREMTTRLPNKFTPLQRILLTANGNVQSIISAYYNSTVTVKVLKNQLITSELDGIDFPLIHDLRKWNFKDSTGIYNREVDIYCMEKKCCHAKSIVSIYCPKVHHLIINKQVGIGQLFRFLNILPEFELLDTGKSETTFWRSYLLKSTQVQCLIRETFPIHVLDPTIV